jgi:hypothetical protein
MYNFYLIANGPNAKEPAFEKIILSEDDAKVAGFEDFQEYIDASLTALAETCVKEDANYVILNQEEFMRLILKMSQKM